MFTTLTKEAFPLIRYRTKDISRLIYEKCACGRTMVRMEKITGCTDDMLIIRSVNVFPSQEEHVLMGVEGVEPHYQIVVNREGNMDTGGFVMHVEQIAVFLETNLADWRRSPPRLPTMASIFGPCRWLIPPILGFCG